MLRIRLSNEPEFIASYETRGAQIVEALVTRLNSLLIRLQAYIVSEKLSGQVLARRSGKLASSIRVIPAVIEGTKVSGEVQGAGGPAFYGRVHEYGGRGPYEILPVRAKALSFLIDGQRIIVSRVMHPPLPARPFMAPSLQEMRETIITELQASFLEGA